MRQDPFAITNLPPMVRWLLIANGLAFVARYVHPELLINFALWPWGTTAISTSRGLLLAPSFHIWQLITYGFLHAGFLHLFFNMFGLWMFGRSVEAVLGGKRFLLYYMVCLVGAGICQLLTLHFFSPGLAEYTIGASGGVFGILLAFGMMFPNVRVWLLIPPIPMAAKWFVIGYGALELFFGVSGFEPGVAHFAHLGGMAFGFVLLMYWRHQALSRR